MQQLPGEAHPFERLASLLALGDYRAAAIDAPFSIPARYLLRVVGRQYCETLKRSPKRAAPLRRERELVAYRCQNAPLQVKEATS